MITMVIFIISIVANTGMLLSACLNMEVSMRHAVVKSAARKNTHVTFTRKNVNSASKKLRIFLLTEMRGRKDARCNSISAVAGFGLAVNFSLISLSAQR